MDLVISPTLNEVDNVDTLIEGVLGQGVYQLLIVDDDSADGTTERVERRMDEVDSLHLLRRTANPGFGASYVDGFRWALAQSAEAVFTMDADLSHRPEYLPALKSSLAAGADVAIGSRYTRGGGVRNWPARRVILSLAANIFAKIATGLPVRDCTAGFIGIRSALLKLIELDSLRCNGYGFLIELKYRLWRAGAKMVEVPIVFHDREHGKTKFNSGMIWEAVTTCFKLRFGRRKK